MPAATAPTSNYMPLMTDQAGIFSLDPWDIRLALVVRVGPSWAVAMLGEAPAAETEAPRHWFGNDSELQDHAITLTQAAHA